MPVRKTILEGLANRAADYSNYVRTVETIIQIFETIESECERASMTCNNFPRSFEK